MPNSFETLVYKLDSVSSLMKFNIFPMFHLHKMVSNKLQNGD